MGASIRTAIVVGALLLLEGGSASNGLDQLDLESGRSRSALTLDLHPSRNSFCENAPMSILAELANRGANAIVVDSRGLWRSGSLTRLSRGDEIRGPFSWTADGESTAPNDSVRQLRPGERIALEFDLRIVHPGPIVPGEYVLEVGYSRSGSTDPVLRSDRVVITVMHCAP